jgi:hypothetical protein
MSIGWRDCTENASQTDCNLPTFSFAPFLLLASAVATGTGGIPWDIVPLQSDVSTEFQFQKLWHLS